MCVLFCTQGAYGSALYIYKKNIYKCWNALARLAQLDTIKKRMPCLKSALFCYIHVQLLYAIHIHKMYISFQHLKFFLFAVWYMYLMYV